VAELKKCNKKLIEAGGKTTLLHHIFQRLGITPDEFYAKSYKVRAFMLASMRVQLRNGRGTN
jgi:hypothetical protein